MNSTKEWKVSPRRWAELWFKMLGGIMEHLNLSTGEYNVQFFWQCPICKIDITSDNREGVVQKIENHLIEDQAKGIIK